MGAREDRPRARGDGAVRRASRRRLAEDAASRRSCRSARRRCTSCSATRAVIAGPLEFREVEEDGDDAQILTGDYAGWVGSWAPSELPAGQKLREPRAALPQARRRDAADELARLGIRDSDRHARASRRARRRPTSVVARARDAGVTRILTVGTDVADCRRALELAERHEASSRSSASIRTRRPTRRATSRESAATARAIRRRSRWARSASTGSATTRRATAQRRLFDAQLALAAELRQAGRDPHARGRRRHARRARRLRRHRRPALLLVAALLADGARARLVRLVRRQRHLPEGGRPAPRGGAGARRPDPRRDRLRRISRRSRCAASRNEPAYVVHTLAALAQARGEDAGRARARRSTQRDRVLRAAMRSAEEGVRPALPGRREHPRRDRPARRARRRRRRARDRPRARRADALPRRARRAACTRSRSTASLEPELRDARRPNVDARLRRRAPARPRRLAPGATKLVANLPYNVATPLVAESLDGLPDVELWCVMVQREVADRFFAAPSTKAYGAVSVLVQLVARADGLPPGVARRSSVRRRTSTRRSSRSGAPSCRADFARRQAGRRRPRSRTGARRSPNSLELAGVATREQAAAALAAIGRAPTFAPRRSTPPEFVALAEALR